MTGTKTPWWKAKTLGEALGVERTAGSLNRFAGVTLDVSAGTVTYRGVAYRLPAHATVETAGELQSRVTVTRLLATGVFAFALKKKRDRRELYLTVESDEWAFVVKVDPDQGLQARQFAAKVNSI